jgi:hypothetical protein
MKDGVDRCGMFASGGLRGGLPLNVGDGSGDSVEPAPGDREGVGVRERSAG